MSKDEEGAMVTEKIPKYYFLKKDIINKIENGEYLPDEPILSERDLIAQYGVSRITVRKAIDDLVNEGYLYNIQGKGTYVKNEDSNRDIFSLVSCTEDVIAAGMTPSKKLIDVAYIDADLIRRKGLQLAADEQVIAIKRVQLANNQELNYTESFLPAKYFPQILDHNLAVESLYKLIENKYGIKILRAVRTFEAILAEDKIAQYLDVKQGTPLILFKCVTYGMINGNETPIEMFQSYYRTDRIKFTINQIR